MLNRLFLLWGKLPLTWIHAVGYILGTLVYGLLPFLRRRALLYIQQTHLYDGPSYESQKYYRKIILHSFRHNACAILDAPCFPQKNLTHIHWIQPFTVPCNHNTPSPLLIICAHLGSVDVVLRGGIGEIAHQHGISAVCIQRPPRSTVMEKALQFRHYSKHLKVIDGHKHSLRPILQTLQQGGMVSFAADHRPAKGSGEMLRFFNRPAYTMTLAAKLSKRPYVRTIYVEARQNFGHYELSWQDITQTLQQIELLTRKKAAFTQTPSDLSHDRIDLLARAQAIK